MASEKSFLDILSETLRQEIRAEIECAWTGRNTTETPKPSPSPTLGFSREQLELWLLREQTPRGSSPRTRPETRRSHPYKSFQKSVATPQSSPTPGPSEPRSSAETFAQIAALEFFKRHDARLPESFTRRELKGAFRKLALKLHPDQNTDAADPDRLEMVFIDLTLHFEELERLFEPRATQGPGASRAA